MKQNNKKKDIGHAHAAAKLRNGRCLSSKYENVKSPLRWTCDKGHTWSASLESIATNKTWCPECGRINRGASRRTGIDKMHEIARAKGGLCLSTEYKNKETRLKWQCQKGHTWEAIPGSIVRGTWCPECVGKRATLADLVKLAENKGGKCLAEKFKGMTQTYSWSCSRGHTWKTTGSKIKTGSWCPECAGNFAISIKELNQIAKKRGGKCLSKESLGMHKKLDWQCAIGHQWSATPSSIKNLKTWCPECSSGFGERLCRLILEHLFQAPFKKTRPAWLKNARGKQMELDGFNADLKIAFEHQGVQHFRKGSMFISSDEQLKTRIEDDRLKEKLCKKNGITLLIIPQLEATMPIEKIKEVVVSECLRKGRTPVNRADLSDSIWQKTYSEKNDAYLDELVDLARSKGGSLISKTYITATTKLEWQCEKKHRWMANPNSIKNGTWCPTCHGRPKITLDDLKTFAKTKGGKCISGEYLNAHEKLVWVCKSGHSFSATWSNVKKGSWCPACARKRN